MCHLQFQELQGNLVGSFCSLHILKKRLSLGIVGRTGAGKSTVTNCLLRLLPYEVKRNKKKKKNRFVG